MSPKAITDEIVFNFCKKILPDYRKIMINLQELHGDLSPDDFAMHLMELGRVQMSEIVDPSEQDFDFMTEYVESLNFDNAEEAFFSAYAGGCILGLVMINEVAGEDSVKAFRLIEVFAQKEFNDNH